MSKMSAPTPIYTTKRAEDMANLNRVLLSLATDERARILTTGTCSILKSGYNGETPVTIGMQYAPYVIAAYSKDNTTFYMMPHINVSGTSTISVTEVVKIKSIVNSGGVTTITFRADSTTSSTETYYVQYIVLKDKLTA